MDDYQKSKNDLVSDFNEAKMQMFRLNNAWERYSHAIRHGNLNGYGGANWELDCISGELSRDAELLDENIEEEPSKYYFKLNKVNDLVRDNKNNLSKLYRILRGKEIILRRLQDEAGKGSKRSSAEDEDDIDT